MRVLMIANNFPTLERPSDGAFVLRQIQALRAFGHEIEVVRQLPYASPWNDRWSYYRNIPPSYDVEGVSVQTLRTVAAPRQLLVPTYGLQLAKRIRAVAGRFKADILHVQGTLPAGLLAAPARIPYVLTAHGSDTYDMPWRFALMQRTAQNVVRGAAACAAVSGFVGDHLLRLGAPDVRIIPNGADEATFAPSSREAARRALEIPQSRRVIAFVGRLDLRKGLNELIDAAAQLAQIEPLVLLAGDGPARDAIRTRAQTAHVEVRFFGAVPQETLARIYAAADVVTLPSHREGLPAVLCEAMLSGRAVVASRAGGIPEIVQDGVTGLLHDVENAAMLADGMRRVLNDSALRARFEDSARVYAVEHLTWTANAVQYDRLYREVLEGEGRSRRLPNRDLPIGTR